MNALQFTQEGFGKWRDAKWKGLKREAEEHFVNAWARVAYVADLKRQVMGAEVSKLQKRIGRQRVANAKLIWKLKEKDLTIRKLNESIQRLEQRLGLEYQSGWEDGNKSKFMPHI